MIKFSSETIYLEFQSDPTGQVPQNCPTSDGISKSQVVTCTSDQLAVDQGLQHQQ